MKIIGVDVDGTLLPEKGRKDNLHEIRRELRRELDTGNRVVLITSRSDPERGQFTLRMLHDINLECVATSRDNPGMKAEYLLSEMAQHPEYEMAELWDNEDWYLNPADRLGIRCLKVEDGELRSHSCPMHYIPWVPKYPCPALRIFPKV